MRILFVHGTGVRRERHDAVFGTIQNALLQRLPTWEVQSCYWGDEFGAALAADGASIPQLSKTRGALDGFAAGPPDQEAAEWSLLLADPLCELRVLEGLGQADQRNGFPGARAAGENVLERLNGQALIPTAGAEADQLALLLGTTGLAEYFPDAQIRVGKSDEFRNAALSAVDSTEAAEVTIAAARALVADLLATAGAEALCTGDERDRIVDLLCERIGGTARFPGGRVGAFLGRLALRVSAQPALNHWRGSLTRTTTPALGDILRYQARGAALREFLRQRINAGPGPTVVLGHSLGGVALVDLLALSAVGEPLQGVELLVTVGSQAPFLCELGASVGLESGRPLPDGFPNWLNIFDRQDLLAYLAEPVFKGDPRVTDHEVSSRQPFPTCHSAYWKLPGVYDRIGRAIGAIE